MYTVQEAAELLKVSPEEVLRLIQTGELQGINEQGQWMISREHLDQYIEQQLHPGG